MAEKFLSVRHVPVGHLLSYDCYIGADMQPADWNEVAMNGMAGVQGATGEAAGREDE
ncbi:hypothetical protein [Acetobacter vaccinii]|uniref:hypothetical protein n=1 Tax=Acetobacter vaccinii TaxID=2592655 RepID=UPI00143CC2AB|nr:hypothetical protein [Acetobacter vaccinii]